MIVPFFTFLLLTFSLHIPEGLLAYVYSASGHSHLWKQHLGSLTLLIPLCGSSRVLGCMEVLGKAQSETWKRQSWFGGPRASCKAETMDSQTLGHPGAARSPRRAEQSQGVTGWEHLTQWGVGGNSSLSNRDDCPQLGSSRFGGSCGWESRDTYRRLGCGQLPMADLGEKRKLKIPNSLLSCWKMDV